VDRDSRRLSHGKGSKIITQSNVPLSSDGDDGDQLMVGSTLYTKSQGRWMPFKSGGGNINDGWHGSQKYVKILPKDFYLDDDHYSDALYHYDLVGADMPANYWTTGNTAGMVHPGADGQAITASTIGMACAVPIPLGYWAIAAKIYSSHTWGPSMIPVRLRTGANEGASNTNSTAGVKIHNASLVDGSTSRLTAADYQSTNARIVFDTAMLGQDSNYLYISINGLFDTSSGRGPVIYGGYVELRRVKTAGAIAEGDSETGGDTLARGG